MRLTKRRLCRNTSGMVDQRSRFAIDDALVSSVAPKPGDVVVELGCGQAYTLAAAGDHAPELTLVGLDSDVQSLAEARHVLARTPAAAVVLAAADLARPLPLASASVDRLICHNVLEQLPDPSAVLADAARVLRPGGLSVWSHTDFESAVFSGGDIELTRRVVRAYADGPEPGCAWADGQIGRKLPALVHHSPLLRLSVDTRVLLCTELRGLADLRLRSTYAGVRDAIRTGTTDLTQADLDAWRTGMERADGNGSFLYSHTTYLVVAAGPGEPQVVPGEPSVESPVLPAR